MDCCSACLCFKDPKRAFVGIGFFSMLFSLVQILVTVSEFTGGWTDNTQLFTAQSSPLSKTVYELYIVLAVMDFILLIFSIVLVCGNERTDEAKVKCHFMPWIILIPFYIIYESAINIYYFYNQLNSRFPASSPLYFGKAGFAIVPIIYWIIKDILLIYAWLFIANHFKHYCPCRPVYFHTSAPQVAQANSSNFYFQETKVAMPESSCKTCGAEVSQPRVQVSQAPVASPSCGCNSGFKIVQQTPMIQAPALRYNQYVDVPAQPMYGCGNQMAGMARGNARPGDWTSSAYNGFISQKI